MNSAFRDWSDIRVFLAVLRAGSTLAAARQIGMAQPTVSRRMDALEHALGLTLFERDTRGFHPTAAAVALREAAEAMERAAETLEGAARSARSSGETIRFTVPPQNISPGFTRIIDDFRTRYPQVTFEFVSSYRQLDLCAGEADIAIRLVAATALDDRLVCRRLTTATHSLYAAQSYGARYGLPRTLEDLAGHRYVVVDPPNRTNALNSWLIENCAPAQIVARVSDLDGLLTSVRSGIGVGPVPTTLAADFPELVRCFPPVEGTGTPVWLLISPQAWRRQEVKRFAAFFAPRWIAHIGRIKADAAGAAG